MVEKKKVNRVIRKYESNIVFILADDMGYELSSLNKNSGIKTPNMDKIVKEGIYFTDAHSTSSVCTPTNMEYLLAVMRGEAV